MNDKQAMRRACGSVQIAVHTAERAVSTALGELTELRITDEDGLQGQDGLDAVEALVAALPLLRSGRRIARLREIELETAKDGDH
jgi:hypothetical protein